MVRQFITEKGQQAKNLMCMTRFWNTILSGTFNVKRFEGQNYYSVFDDSKQTKGLNRKSQNAK